MHITFRGVRYPGLSYTPQTHTITLRTAGGRRVTLFALADTPEVRASAEAFGRRLGIRERIQRGPVREV